MTSYRILKPFNGRSRRFAPSKEQSCGAADLADARMSVEDLVKGGFAEEAAAVTAEEPVARPEDAGAAFARSQGRAANKGRSGATAES